MSAIWIMYRMEYWMVDSSLSQALSLLMGLGRFLNKKTCYFARICV